MLRSREFWTVVVSGIAMGAAGVLLSVMGNPENSGICVSCFIETSAWSLGMHDNQTMQYLRPELIGFVLGSSLTALLFREFRSRGGSSPLPRFFLGMFMIFGCAVFIGCPIKLALRLSAGDLGAWLGAAGLAGGVWMGLKGLAAGVELERNNQNSFAGGGLMPLVFVLLLFFLFLRPGFILFSERGGGAQHAPMLLSLAVGAVLGLLAQRSRFCITGGIRDVMLMGARIPALWGLLAFAAAALVSNVLTGGFNWGLYGQPGAHQDHIWAFLGMWLVGWVSVLIGGCPFRQMIKAGEGDADAGMVVLGMFTGGALSQSWGIAATAAGVPFYGKAAVLAGFALMAIYSIIVLHSGRGLNGH